MVLTKEFKMLKIKFKVLNYVSYGINAVLFPLSGKCLLFKDWYQRFVLLTGVSERSP